MLNRMVQIAAIRCDRMALPGAARPGIQQQIADRAFDLWLARGFRKGSPQEDWLQAQREVQHRNKLVS